MNEILGKNRLGKVWEKYINCEKIVRKEKFENSFGKVSEMVWDLLGIDSICKTVLFDGSNDII